VPAPDNTTTDRGWKLSDKLQLIGIVASLAASLAALVLGIFATLSANDATSKANQLAASASSASLLLASPVTAHMLPGTSMYRVSLDLVNQGGGTARLIVASIATVAHIQKVKIASVCPTPVHSYSFIFPLGTALGTNGQQLSGSANVPTSILPPHGTPTNSMVLYVSWQDTDGSAQTNCVSLSNGSHLGNLVRHPS